MADTQASGPAEDAGNAEATARPRRAEGGSEDHWSVVLKKLAPQGYQKSPAWQQEIIERVVKQMTARQKESRAKAGVSKETLARTIDLTALGVSAEAAETFRAEEQRVAKSMRSLPVHSSANLAASMASVGSGAALEDTGEAEREPTAAPLTWVAAASTSMYLGEERENNKPH